MYTILYKLLLQGSNSEQRNIFTYENDLLNYKLSEIFLYKRNKASRVKVSINIFQFSPVKLPIGIA